MGHGGGGMLSEELIENLFLPAFGSGRRVRRRDSALLTVAAGRIAVSTDSYVVQPLFFPGGNIGDLAVNGTINDLAMSGAQPIGLTAGFILEEGLELEVLGRHRADHGQGRRQRGRRRSSPATPRWSEGAVPTSFSSTPPASAWCRPGVDIGPERARPGDHIIVSGNVGEHGVAIMSVREGIDFGTVVTTDSAPLHRLVAAMLAAGAASGARRAHAARPDPRRARRLGRRDRQGRSASGSQLDEARDPGARRQSRRRARFSGWIRCRWPTRASWWPSSTRRTARRCSRRCAPGPRARTPPSSAASSPNIPAWRWARRRSAPPG